jgi:type I site-specific restriction endonuclease
VTRWQWDLPGFAAPDRFERFRAKARAFLRQHADHVTTLNLIVDHLTEHGVLDAARLYESPFTDVAPRGPDGIFPSPQVDELVAVLQRVKAAALAA